MPRLRFVAASRSEQEREHDPPTASVFLNDPPTASVGGS